MNYNKVMIGGRLCADPELRMTAKGTAVCECRLATNRKFGEGQEEVLFVDVTFWAKQAETVHRYLTKGKPLFVEGRLKLDEWQDKDGSRRSKIRVIAENFQFVGGRDDQQQEPRREQAPTHSFHGSEPAAPAAHDDDRMPF